VNSEPASRDGKVLQFVKLRLRDKHNVILNGLHTLAEGASI